MNKNRKDENGEVDPDESCPHEAVESKSPRQKFQIDPSKVDKLTWSFLQKSPSRCSLLVYCSLARLFEWRHRVVSRLQSLEQRANTYYGFSQSYVVIQDVIGCPPRRVAISDLDGNFSSQNVIGQTRRAEAENDQTPSTASSAPTCCASSISEDELAFWDRMEKEYEEKGGDDPDFISGTGHPLGSPEDLLFWKSVIQSLYEENTGYLRLYLSVRGRSGQ